MNVKYTINGMSIKDLLSPQQYFRFQYSIRKGLSIREAYERALKPLFDRYGTKYVIDGKPIRELLGAIRYRNFVNKIYTKYWTVEEAYEYAKNYKPYKPKERKTCTCLNCGKSFERWASRIKSDNVFCCNHCRAQYYAEDKQ